MPTGYVKKIARVYGRSTETVEKLWMDAKKIVKKKYKIKTDAGLTPRKYAEITGIFKKMVFNKFGPSPNPEKVDI